MPICLPQKIRRSGALVLLAGVVAGCHHLAPGPTEPIIEPPLPPPVQTRSSTPIPVPRMGVVTDQIAGHERLFSTFGFWMMDEPLKTQLLGCFRPNGTLDHAKLRQALPDAHIVEGKDTVAVALPTGNFTFFLLRDGPLVSLDPRFDAMVRQMSAKASTE